MKNTLVRYSVLVSMGLTAAGLTSSASAVSPEFRMLSLAMHQETGRNIYLGAIHLETDAPDPNNLLQDSAPKLMEYRVIARRTSLRSLLGNMLLQSEVATGNRPSSETVEFAGQLLSTVKGSLYAGDSFEITQSKDMRVSAYLNGLELVNAEDIGIFDYFLMGWISESGPSSTFRSSIMKTDIDGSLLLEYSSHTPSQDRMAVVSSWSASASPETNTAADEAEAPIEAEQAEVVEEIVDPGYLLAEAAKTEQRGTDELAPKDPPEPPPSNSSDTVTTEIEASPADPGTVENAMAPASQFPAGTRQIAVSQPAVALVETIATIGLEGADQDTKLPRTAGIGEQTPAFEQLASLNTQIGTLRADHASPNPGMGSLDEIQSLDVTEYSLRLAGFNTELIKLVYSRIKYPRRAVRRDIQGALELDVTVQENGTLVAVTVAESSGYSILDRAAVVAAEEALGSSSLGAIDPVAVAEYGSNGTLVVPVPVAFVLQ